MSWFEKGVWVFRTLKLPLLSGICLRNRGASDKILILGVRSIAVISTIFIILSTVEVSEYQPNLHLFQILFRYVLLLP